MACVVDYASLSGSARWGRQCMRNLKYREFPPYTSLRLVTYTALSLLLVCAWGESCPSNIWASSSSLTTHVFMHHNNCRVIWLSVMLRSSDLRDLLYCVEQWSVSNSAEWRRSKAVCPLHPAFSVRTVFIRIEPREKHFRVVQWLRVGSVSIAYDSDFYSSGNCSFRLCSYWLYSDFDPSCFFFRTEKSACSGHAAWLGCEFFIVGVDTSILATFGTCCLFHFTSLSASEI